MLIMFQLQTDMSRQLLLEELNIYQSMMLLQKSITSNKFNQLKKVKFKLSNSEESLTFQLQPFRKDSLKLSSQLRLKLFSILLLNLMVLILFLQEVLNQFKQMIKLTFQCRKLARGKLNLEKQFRSKMENKSK